MMDKIEAIIENMRTIAVVGLSDKKDRPSYRVANYLMAQGYRIIPVNPRVGQVLGQKSYASVKDIPENVDVVNIFRKVEAVPQIVDDAIRKGAKAVWMQEGINDQASAEKAEKEGLKVVMDRCIMKDHRELV